MSQSRIEVTRIATRVLLCSLPLVGICSVLNIPIYFGIELYPVQYLALFLAIALSAIFLSKGARRGTPATKVPWYDLVLVALSLIVGGYVAIFYSTILYTVSAITPTRLIFGFIAIVLVLEAVRRTTGLALVIIALFFILYAHYTDLFPGMLYGPGLSWQRLLVFYYLDSNALFGVALGIAVEVVLPFILFGVLFTAVGGGEFITNIAMSVIGRFRGGAAKMSVLSSGLFGMLSGSAVANVVVDGPITIPLMKRSGFSSHFSAAVEAVASTGGVIMPPVMGAAAFLMAEFLSIPYWSVALSAAIPAFLYYAAAYFAVDFEAAKRGMRGLDRHEIPSLKQTLIKGWPFVIPVIVLIYILFILYLEPGEVGIWSAASILLASLFKKETRRHLRHFINMLATTGETLLELTAICALVGFVIGTVGITGLGLSFSQMLIHVSGGNLLLLLILAAIGSTILGMGLPVTAVYLLLVILIAPALLELGISPLPAHFFILYWANLSFLTPPVCLAVYAAAAIGEADPLKTAWSAMRIGISAYVVPFVFVFYPSLLLIGPLKEAILPVITAILSMVVLQGALSGYLFIHLNLASRILLVPAAIGLLIPGWLTDLGGLSLTILVLLWRLCHQRRAEVIGDATGSSSTSTKQGGQR